MHLVDKFLEVDCLGFCFQGDAKRKSLPQIAASELPLFSQSRKGGCPRRGLHVGLWGFTRPLIWSGSEPYFTPKPPAGHPAMPALGWVRVSTPAFAGAKAGHV